jgi:hypothetical protein
VVTDRAQKALDVLSLMVLEDGSRWGQTAAPFQWENARSILDPDAEPRQTWIELPRGARKTTDLAGIHLALLYAQAPPMARLYVGASDEEQAQELIDAALGLIERTPEVAGVFRTGELEITCNTNGASVRALAADASAMGKRAWMITLDEVANWPETRKARRFWGVLTSGNRKLAACRTVVITNAGDPQHWAWKRRETARTSRHWRFVSIAGPLPWLTADDLEILAENAETVSDYERLHLNKWTTSEDRLASRADLKACTTLPGDLPPVPGVVYVVCLDVGIVNDRTVLAVMHAEHSPAGRRVVLDRIDRWRGTKSAPVDLSDVRDTLIARAQEYRARAVVDPHQAVLIAQEARDAGVGVDEFAFSSTSVGRLALSLHQAIRNRRIALPDDEILIDELASVRLRKNTLGIYRLDHDSGQHDDQAVTLALGTYHLLDDDSGTSATVWLAWAKRKAEQAVAARELREQEAAAERESGAPVAAPVAAFSDSQIARARALIAAGRVTPAGDGSWLVAGRHGSYVIGADGACSCTAGAHGRACYHSLAARLLVTARSGESAPAAVPPGWAAAAGAPIEGVVVPLDAEAAGVAARKRARDEAFRANSVNGIPFFGGLR